MPSPKLVINKNSWHYALYSWVRKLYGCDMSGNQTSLCPYCQTILWGTLVALVTMPLILLGWMWSKGLRVACTKLKGRRLDGIIDWFTNTTWIGRMVSCAPRGFSEAFVIYGVSSGVVALVVGAILFGIGALAYVGIINLSVILQAVVHCVLVVGWAGFWLCHGSVWLVVQVAYGMAWFFTNGEIWLLIAKTIGILLAAGVSCTVLAYLMMLFCKTRLAKWIWDFYTYKFNGFNEAEEERRKRIVEAEWTCEYCDHPNSMDRYFCKNCSEKRLSAVGVWFNRMWGGLTGLTSQFVKIAGNRVHVMGFFSVVWVYLCAVKKGVCPLVEFVSEGDLQQQARDAGVEMSKKEEAEKKDG